MMDGPFKFICLVDLLGKTAVELILSIPEGPSRRISNLAPGKVNSPLATKVDKFTMIPHPGK